MKTQECTRFDNTRGPLRIISIRDVRREATPGPKGANAFSRQEHSFLERGLQES